MKTPFAVCAVLLCMLCADQTTPVTTLFPTSCNAAPYAVDVQQPDGSTLTIQATGNALVHYTQTTDEYTLVKGAAAGYEYALSDASGNLVPSGILAHNLANRKRKEKKAIKDISKRLRLSDARSQEELNTFRSQPEFISDRDARQFPSAGDQKVLVILIGYPDLENQFANSEFNSLMNESEYNGTGSFRDYFAKNSFGQLNLNADVFGWFTSEEDHDYYGFQNGFQRSRELMAEAIDAAEDAGVDFSQYDNDGDGIVDAVIGIHSGPGAEVGAQTQYIWSHRWTLGSSYERSYDGVTISDYMINPETRPWGMVGVGVFCHEFGHVLGLPDLYDTDNSSSGIGNWGLMAKGAWLNLEKTPANLNAWSKYAKNWIEPEVITSGAFSLQTADEHASCYRINTDDPGEYFLVENRQKVGNDAFLPGSGLAVWHVDEDKTSMYPSSNEVNSDEGNKGVDLEEADGLFQLDTGPFNGDDGDLFPGNTMCSVFNDLSVPSSRMNNGTSTDISVTNIREINETLHFRLNDEASCAILSASASQQYDCDNGTYDQDIIIYYEYEPLQGELSVNGRSFPITGSPQTVLLSDLPADGSEHNLVVAFTMDLSCEFTAQDAFTAPSYYNSEITTATCDPNEAGTITNTYSSVSGCDSTVTVTTVLMPSYDLTIHETTCSFDLAGTFVNTYVAVGGCDSTVTLINEYIIPDTLVITATTCDQQEAGIETFHFISAGGCDSIVRKETLLLQSYNQDIISFTCDPAEAGNSAYVFETVDGCDSVVNLVIQLVPSYDIYYTENTCDEANVGTETLHLTSQYGCDSIVTITRELIDVQAVFDYTKDGVHFTFSNPVYSDGHYIWSFGDGSIATVANPEHQFEEAGTYEVKLAVWTDNCPGVRIYGLEIVVEDWDQEIDHISEDALVDPVMHVYPNPSFGAVNVEISGFNNNLVEMSIYDINGHLIHQEQMEEGIALYDYDLSHVGPGLYLMQVASKDKVASQKVFLTN